MNFDFSKSKDGRVLGFTLIELLIVIAIIGILAVAFLPSLLNSPAKARDAQRLADIQKIEKFLVAEALTGDGTFPASGSFCVDPAEPIGVMIQGKIADFGGVFPVDPLDGHINENGDGDCENQYTYLHFDDGKEYSAAISANVEVSSNANAVCNDLKENLADGFALDPGGAGLDCYVVLIQ